MGRLANSWQTFKTSLAVVKKDPELMWLPVLSGAASIAALMGIMGIGVLGGAFPEVTNPDGSAKPLSIVLGFAMYLGLAFVQTYFFAAMVAGANERLGGGDPTVNSALSAANKRIGKLFLWSVVLATVNVILQAIRERSGALGQFVTGLVGGAWNLATYFVVPILMFEDEGIGASTKRSVGLFKKTWGETVVGQFGLGWVMAIILIPVGMILFLLVSAMSSLGTGGFIVSILIAVAVLAVLLSLFSVVQAVYKTELYRFATRGQQDEEFGVMDLQRAYVGRA